MLKEKLKQSAKCQWRLEPFGDMKVPAIIFGDRSIIADIDDNIIQQAVNVATLPGIVTASYAMPDAHWGYGFPIGGVAAFDPEKGGVVSAGGVGFDISCGVRTLKTGLTTDSIAVNKRELAEALFAAIPAGLGKGGKITLDQSQTDRMLTEGAAWAVQKGYGTSQDLEHTEEKGRMAGADPKYVSQQAKNRQKDQMGTLGSGNHYLEVQKVTEVFDKKAADIFGLSEGDILVSIHCGSRGLGHQIATDFLSKMVTAAKKHGIALPDKQLACAPIKSDIGQQYLAAMNCGINFALANRQVLTELTRRAFAQIFSKAELTTLYDVSHNTCKAEKFQVNGKTRTLYIHRKGATRALARNNPFLPEDFKSAGQPVIVGGTMGTASYILAGTEEGIQLAFSSACHGAGRAMSRKKATRTWHGKQIIRELAGREIIIMSRSSKGVAEEAPGAYKDVTAVVNATEKAALARKVVKLEPLICVKG